MILQNWWYTTLLGVDDPIQPPLRDHIKADVVVVGGGAAGLAAALQLMDKGVKVVLLERNICGGSSTGKSAGFLTPDSEMELVELVRRFGPQGAQDIWEVATQGVEIMISAVKRHGIECDLIKQDSLMVGNGGRGWKTARAETDARKLLGYPYTLYTAEELPSVLGSNGYSGAVRYPGTYAINPLLYAQGIKQVLIRHGVQVYEASQVVAIDGRTIRTHLGSVTAGQIIFCADKLKPSLTEYCWHVYYTQTFLAISEPLEQEDIAAMFPHESFQCWDTDLIYTYFRLTGDGRLVVGGGSLWTTYSSKDVTTPHIIEHVIRRFKEKFPCIEEVEFIQYWPGRIDTTRDLLPTIVRDEHCPWVHYVLGSVGLPWATFSGDFAARHVIDDKSCDDHKYYRYFSIDRGFLVPLWLENILGRRIVFALNNAWSMYYQIDKGREVPYKKDQF